MKETETTLLMLLIGYYKDATTTSALSANDNWLLIQ